MVYNYIVNALNNEGSIYASATVTVRPSLVWPDPFPGAYRLEIISARFECPYLFRSGNIQIWIC